jgi:glutamyl-tRNA reductase
MSQAPNSNPAAGSSLLLLGVNHTTAPVEVRERLAIPSERLADATRTLAHQPGIREALILSTCNRVELLTVQDHPAASSAPAADASATGMLRFLEQYLNVRVTDIQPHVYEHREREAIRHVFRVASSLDSMVVGEPQILGQVKQSWSVARAVGAIQSTDAAGSARAFSSVLDPLLQRAFSVAKRVRTETRIGSSTVSIASVAAELARKIFGSLAGKTVLIVGAGKMSDLTARHLVQNGCTTLLVSNRTSERAEAMAAALRSPTAAGVVTGAPSGRSLSAGVMTGVIPFEQLHQQSHRADIIITSTGAGQVFTTADARALLQRRRNRPVFFIDIAVPRDVDPAVNKVEGCFVYDIDDLQQVAAQNQTARSREAEAAESIIAGEVARYSDRMAQAPATESIKQLLLDAEVLRLQEVARLTQQLSSQPLTAEQIAAIDRVTRSLTAKLLHPQLTRLRTGHRSPGDDAE